MEEKKKYPEFAEKLRQLRLSAGLNQEKMAEMLGVKYKSYQSWEEGRARPRPDDGRTIANFFGVALEDLYGAAPGQSTAVSEPPFQYVKAPNGKVPRRNNGSNEVPFYDADFEAGGGVMFYEDIRTSTPAYTMDVPDFAGCTAFRTYGHSMEPLIASGAILFGTKDEQWRDFLEYGQIYGIVCHNGRRYLKQVRKSKKSETHLLLISENEAYDPFDLPMDVIKSMWLIHGWLNKNT